MTVSGHELVHMQTWQLTTALHRQGLPLSAIYRVYGAVETERWCSETVRGLCVCWTNAKAWNCGVEQVGQTVCCSRSDAVNSGDDLRERRGGGDVGPLLDIGRGGLVPFKAK